MLRWREEREWGFFQKVGQLLRKVKFEWEVLTGASSVLKSSLVEV
jgi:hypothetical protein